MIPDDLSASLADDDAARANFERFPPSSQRIILEWIASAKKPETRARRIDQTVEMAHRNERANHPPTAGRHSSCVPPSLAEIVGRG